MARLTDLQRILLAAAAARDGGSLRPLPGSAADDERTSKAIAQLVARGLAAEREVQSPSEVHRRDDDTGWGVFITDSGYAAIGIEPDASGDEAGNSGPVPLPSPPALAPAAPSRPSKQELVLALLARDGGATVVELVEATSWLPHSTRAVLTGLRKKGHAITRGKRDEVTCYTIVAAAR